MEDPDKIEAALAQLNTYIESRDAGHLRGEAYWAEGEMEEDRGNYEAAIAAYRRQLGEDPTAVLIHRSIGRCQRKAGQYEAARASIAKVLNVYPNNALTNYEMALVYHGLGDPAKAVEHLNRAMERWNNADATYKPAQEARAKLAQWQS
jgi:tetratricopeptide (TPR) repeat protein